MTIKKKSLIIISIIVVVLLITAGVVAFCIVKHKAGQRYLQYEELEPTQIVLIGEYIFENSLTEDGKEIRVSIVAIDAEGDLYSTELPYEGWSGIEEFFEEIPNGEKTVNYIYDEDMVEIYGYILQTNVNAEYYEYSNAAIAEVYPVPYWKANFYGLRYRANGEKEYIKYWEELSYEEIYILDDPNTVEIEKFVNGPL